MTLHLLILLGKMCRETLVITYTCSPYHLSRSFSFWICLFAVCTLLSVWSTNWTYHRDCPNKLWLAHTINYIHSLGTHAQTQRAGERQRERDITHIRIHLYIYFYVYIYTQTYTATLAHTHARTYNMYMYKYLYMHVKLYKKQLFWQWLHQWYYARMFQNLPNFQK